MPAWHCQLYQYETRGLLALTLVDLIEFARIESLPQARTYIRGRRWKRRRSHGGPAVATSDHHAARRSLVETVCYVGLLNDQELTTRLTAVDKLTVSWDWKNEIREFCEALARSYVVVAECTWPKSQQLFSITYEQQFPLDSRSQRQYNRLRRLFGLLPSTIDAPRMSYGFRAKSYHFEFDAGHGQYVYDHRLEFVTTRERITQDQLAPYGRPYVRTYREKGRSNAHCYIRRQLRASETGKPPDIKSVIEVREIPPGPLGGAAVVAAAAALLIGFFALTRIALDSPTSAVGQVARAHQRIFEAAQASVNSDVPALLIAVPAFIALLVGHWADPTRLPRSSLSAYFGLLGTMSLSLIAALLFLLDANRVFATEIELSLLEGAWKLKSDLIWLGLTGLAVLQSAYLWWRLYGQTRYYASLPKAGAKSP